VSHYTPEELIGYRLDPESSGEELKEHVRTCGECIEALADCDAIDEALRHERTWEAVTELSPGQSARLAEAKALQAEIRREDEDAARRLARRTGSRIHLLNARIPNKAVFRHAGTVRVLCRIAHEMHERKPRLSLELATQAYEVALRLDAKASSPPRYCLGLSMRERANALRYLGRFTEALEVLDAAEKCFDADGAGDAFDLARLRFIRATLLYETDRLTEAAQAACAARVVFRDFGDQRRELDAMLLEAGCRMLTGEHAEAAPIFDELIGRCRGVDETTIRARALANGAMLCVRRGDFGKATARYFEAVVIFEELGLRTEIARTNWQIARLVTRRGDLMEGTKLLERAQAELAAEGMTNDAALATLDWAEARLATGHSEGVAAACRRIVVTFESQSMTRQAQIALAFLHEALAKGTATPTVVRHVRMFIEELPRNPSRGFVPLQN
jgi:tetratricopeptide (TPR) repeat protein